MVTGRTDPSASPRREDGGGAASTTPALPPAPTQHVTVSPELPATDDLMAKAPEVNVRAEGVTPPPVQPQQGDVNDVVNSVKDPERATTMLCEHKDPTMGNSSSSSVETSEGGTAALPMPPQQCDAQSSSATTTHKPEDCEAEKQ